MTAKQVQSMLETLGLFLSLRTALCLCFIHRQTRVLHQHWDIYPTMDIISIVAILSRCSKRIMCMYYDYFSIHLAHWFLQNFRCRQVRVIFP